MLALTLVVLAALGSACAAKPAEPPKTTPSTTPPLAATAAPATPAAKKPAFGGEIVWTLQQGPKIFNSMLANDAYSNLVINVVYDGLLKANTKFEMEPWLAQDMPQISADGLVYTMKLRSGVKFHDGSPLTADDVVFTYNLPLHQDYKGPRRATFADVAKVEAVDPSTVRFTLKQPSAPFITSLAFGVMSKKAFDGVAVADIERAKASMQPMGSGPFKFVEFKTDQYVMTEANRDWFMKDKGPFVDKLRFQIVPDSNTQIAKLEAGEVDVLTNTPPQHVDRLKKEKANVLNTYDWPRNGYGYIAFNTERFPTNSKAVRQALSTALDRDAVVKGVLDGQATAAIGPIPPISWAFDSTLKGYGFDLKQAATILEQDGWKKNARGIYEKNGQPLKLTFMASKGSTVVEGILTQARKNWTDLGVDVTVDLLDFQVMIDQYLAPGKFEATFFGFGLGTDPDPYSLYHSSAGKPDDKGMVFGFNRARYNNPRADQLLEQGRRETDKNKRKQIYADFQKQILEDAPYAWVYVNTYTDFASKKIKGVVNYPGYGIYVDPFTMYINEQ